MKIKILKNMSLLICSLCCLSVTVDWSGSQLYANPLKIDFGDAISSSDPGTVQEGWEAFSLYYSIQSHTIIYPGAIITLSNEDIAENVMYYNYTSMPSHPLGDMLFDGVFTGNPGSEHWLILTLSGIVAGTHPMTSYHHVSGAAWDAVDIYVDGTQVVDGLAYSGGTNPATPAFATYDVVSDGFSDIIVEFKVPPGDSVDHVWISGFEIDLPAVNDPNDVVIYHVNGQDPNASDANPGTLSEPLLTVGKGIDLAMMQKTLDVDSVVNIHPGVYREGFYKIYSGGVNDATVVIEADQPGTVTISGADIWPDGWSQQGQTDVYTHNWPYDWGFFADPWAGGDGSIPPIVRRREIVFVNDNVYRQVLDPADLEPGMFYVDESADELSVNLLSGTNINNAIIEVGVRGAYPDLFRLDSLNNLTIRGLRFEKSANKIYTAAFTVADCNNLLVEDCQMEWNNYTGFNFSFCTNAVIRRVRASYNGSKNSVFRCENILFEDCETSYNNWRGAWGEYYGWDVAGVKAMYNKDITFRNHASVGNMCGGLWFDTDTVNITIEDCFLSKNYLQGLVFENIQGPIAVRNCVIAFNDWAGIAISKGAYGTIEGNIFYGNRGLGREGGATYAQLAVGGPVSYSVTSVWPPYPSLIIISEHWKWLDNIYISTNDHTPFCEVPNWSWFLSTFEAERNSGFHPLAAQAFKFGGTLMDLAGWQSATGQDLDFVFDQSVTPDPNFCGDAGTVYLIGDINEDCYIDLLDYSKLGYHWLDNNCVAIDNCYGSDLDENNLVSLLDLIALVENWLKCTDPRDVNCE